MVQEFLSEFLGGSSHTEEWALRYVGYRFEFRGQKPSGISGSLISTLSFSDVLLKLLVQLVEVGDKVNVHVRKQGRVPGEW